MSQEALSRDQLHLLPADSLASLLVKPGSEEAKEMTATSGQRCSELLKSTSPLGLLVRMLLESRVWMSEVAYLKWEVKALQQKRVTCQASYAESAATLRTLATKSKYCLFQLAVSELGTKGTVYGLWPTLTTTNILSKKRVDSGDSHNNFCEFLYQHYQCGSIPPTLCELMMGFPQGWTDVE